MWSARRSRTSLISTSYATSRRSQP
jgi:hypothetical protein